MARGSSRGDRRRLRQRSRSSSRGSGSDNGSDSDGQSPGRRRRHSQRDASLSFEHLEAIRGVTLITRNEYPIQHLSRDKLFKAEDADAECFCTFPRPNEPQSSRCDDVSCLNFATYIECNPSRCAAGKYCRNQRLQHPNRFPTLEAFKTEHKGYGVRSREEIEQGTVIGEYVGEIIDEKEMQRRLASIPRQELNFYYLALEPGVYIDARIKGSFTRFMNHSCEPNCKTEKWTVNGDIRIAVLAIRSIAEGEELTFDYQWKALGSQQIKCYCGAVSCKGVIGSEVDATKTIVDNSSVQGFFREPLREEIGAVLVGRRIRLFHTATDTSVYSIATIRGYSEDDSLYDLVYEDDDGTPEENAFDSPTSEASASRDSTLQPPRVDLAERSWQLYVELDGMSSDQIEQAVFSIPKRRPSGTPSELAAASDSPSKLELSGATTSPSQSSTTPSSTPGLTATPSTQLYATPMTQQYERRDHDGELLDADGDIVTTKLLIKGLPTTCDEALLRKTLVAPRRTTQGSMREQLQSNIMAQSSSSSSIIVTLDVFFFDSTAGWALIEFSDVSYPKMFRRNLNLRLLHDKQLRVFLAGRKEVENFERAKRNSSIRRYDDRSAADNAKSDNAVDEKPLVRPRSYPYGRALDWLVSVDQAEDSPTRRKGTSALAEDRMRTKYVQTVLQITKRLHLERDDATSAVLALHRYFTFRPMNPAKSIECIAAGMLHLYLKANSRKFSWPDFVCELYVSRYQKQKTDARLSPDSDLFKTCERQILETEWELLDGLLFDVSSSDPYSLLELVCSTSKRLPRLQTVSIPSEVQREAKHLVAEVLRLSVWVHTSPECVALSAFYVATAVVHALTFTTNPGTPFTPGPIPGYLPFLDPVESEKDLLALLECSLSIVEGLKDRWIRHDKQARVVPQATSDLMLDVEQFTLHRHKTVEITQRITLVLKAWIDLQGIERYQTTHPVAMKDLRLPNMVEHRRIKASDSLAGAKTPVIPPRIHVRDITEVDMLRKRAYLGRISSTLDVYELAGTPVFAQPWPYLGRDKDSVMADEGGVSIAAMREVTTAVTVASRAPTLFLPLLGVVFPDAGDDLSISLDDGGDKRHSLRSSSHYLVFEQPLHLYSGLIEAKTVVPPRLKKKALFDLLSALSLCHEWNYVHRHVSTSNLFVFQDGVRLGGLYAMRKFGLKHGVHRYELNELDRKEHFSGSWLHVTPPEVLLGDELFSSRGDIWSAGCVALAILIDGLPFFQGSDLKNQIQLIFRMVGTPAIEWSDGCKLRYYAKYKPREELKRRVRKTMVECGAVPPEAIDVLDAMLHLDPSKRLSAKKLLEMDYFAEFRQPSSEPVDFASLPPSFEALKKKLARPQHAAAGSHQSSKRRRVSSIEQDRGGSPSIENGSSLHKSRSHSHHHSSSRRPNSEDVKMEDDGDVPLPKMLQDVAMLDSHDDRSKRGDASTNVKRTKLGWGMGLNS